MPTGVYKHQPDVDTDDVDAFGRQLLPGSIPINLRRADGSVEALLIRKRANPQVLKSVCDASGLQPVLCEHGLSVRRGYDPMTETAQYDETGGELPPNGGHSWVRGNAISAVKGGPMGWKFGCVVCFGDQRPKDELIKLMLVARDGTVPQPEDLPEWAR